VGAVDVNSNPDEMEVLTNPTEMNSVSIVLCSPPHGHNIVSMELAYIPTDPQEEVRIQEEDTVLVERLQ